MASFPSFDPNEVSFKVDRDRWTEARERTRIILSKIARCAVSILPARPSRWSPRSPASKPASSPPKSACIVPAATPSGATTSAAGRRHGSVYLHEAIKQSCDVYFYETVKRVGIDRLAVISRKLGLGQVLRHWLGRTEARHHPRHGVEAKDARAALVSRRDHQLRHRPGLCLDHAASARRRDRADRHGQGGAAALDRCPPSPSPSPPRSTSIPCISSSSAPAWSAW